MGLVYRSNVRLRDSLELARMHALKFTQDIAPKGFRRTLLIPPGLDAIIWRLDELLF